MAFVQDVMDEEENNQQQPGGVVTTSGSSSGVVGQGTQTSQASKPKGFGWTNLQNYISANAGNDAAMGSRIAGKIGEQAAGVEQASTGLSTKAAEDAQRNTVTDMGVIQGLQKDPTKVSKEAFQKQSTAVYRGPEDVSAYEEYGRGQKAKSALSERLDLTKSAEGQGALLKDIAGQNYTPGLKNLDQFILGAGEQGKKSIADTQTKYGSVGSQWDALTGQLNQGFRQAKETTTKTAADTRKAFEDAFGATTGAIKGAETKAQQTNEQRRAEVKAIEDAFVTGRTSDIEAKTGIPAATALYLKDIGFTPQEIIQYSGDVNLADMANPEDLARYQALADLGDRASEFSFTPSGRSQQAFNVKRNVVDAADRARAIKESLTGRVSEQQAQRDTAFNRVQDKIARGVYDDEVASATGLTRQEFNLARTGQYGRAKIDSPFALTQGKRLNAGDVATPEQRQQWNQLMQVLGSRDPMSVLDSQDEGAAIQTNLQDFRRGIENAKTVEKKFEEVDTAARDLFKGMSDRYTMLDNSPTGRERRDRMKATYDFVSSNAPLNEKIKRLDEYYAWAGNNPIRVKVG